MEFHLPDDQTLSFRAIHPLLAELVRTIPSTTDPSTLSDTAENRLYPEPSAAPELGDMRSDWHAFVEPELHRHFQSARDIVTADLRRMRQSADLFEITIPRQHTDAWLNVLNQARLTLAADLGFDQKALESNGAPDLLSETGVTVFRINLYAFMQQCLVETLEED